MQKTLIGGLIAIALMASACGFGTTTETTSTGDLPASTTVPVETTTTTEPPARPTTSLAVTPGTTDQALLDAIDELIVITEQVRGLAFLEKPTITVVTETELAERVRDLIEEELDPEETAESEALFELLGILDPTVELGRLYADLYAEQVAGYYDGDAKEMVIPSGQELTSLQKLTVVHELVHALTDQHFDFNSLGERLDDEERYEEAAGLQALVEGDASWAELIYYQTFMSAEEQEAVLVESGQIETGVLDQTPDFLRDLLVFPYDFEGGGASFVADLWLAERSFAAVDEAYADPPTTTEQIVDPARYRNRELPIDVQLPDTTLDGYEVVDEGVWGQVGFEFLFAQALPVADAERASVGWGGDEYRVLYDGEQTVFVVHYVGDSTTDEAEMADVLDSFVEVQIPTENSAYVGTSDEGGVVFVVSSGPDAAEVANLLLPGF